MNNWWAEGDTPIRADSQVMYCIDARSTLLTMCHRFLAARSYIYLAGWGMVPQMRLVRGTDHRAGSDGSPEQEALLDELRAQGLGEAEIGFWYSHELTVGAARSKLENALYPLLDRSFELLISPPIPCLQPLLIDAM